MMASEHQYACSIWGPTCDGLDCIVNECMLPELDIGEWIIFRDMGAYTMAAASCFNGMPKPKCYYFLSEQDWYADTVSVVIYSTTIQSGYAAEKLVDVVV